MRSSKSFKKRVFKSTTCNIYIYGIFSFVDWSPYYHQQYVQGPSYCDVWSNIAISDLIALEKIL